MFLKIVRINIAIHRNIFYICLTINLRDICDD